MSETESLTKQVLATRLGKLTSALSVSVLGYNFLSDPENFVLAVVYRAIVDMVLGFGGEIGLILSDIWGILEDALVGGLGYALGAPGRAIAGLILDLLDLLDGLVADLAASAGPFGIVVAIGACGVVTLGVLGGAVGLWRLYHWIRTVIV